MDDTGGINIYELKAKARSLKLKKDIQILFIDYLQLINGDSGKSTVREQEISKISRDLKELAKELAIPIIVLSQLNREVEKRGDPKPRTSDLRESGAIEQDADIIIFQYWPAAEKVAKYNGAIDINKLQMIAIEKNRNGDITEEPIFFDKSIQKFIEIQDFIKASQPFTPPPSNAAIYQAGRDRMLGESREKINWDDPNF